MPSLRPLFALSLLAVVASFILDQQEFTPWLSSALLNTGSGILTSLVIIKGYNNTVEQRLEKERAVRERGAILGFSTTVRQHYRVLLDCYRGAYEHPEPPRFQDVNELLGPNFHSVFGLLNIYAPSPASSDGTTPFYRYINDSFADFQREISVLLTRHGNDLSHDIFTKAQNLLNSEFMRVATSLNAICTVDIPNIGRVPSNLLTGMKPQIDTYCARFGQLLNAIESTYPQGLRTYDASDWNNLFFPAGHARIA